MNCIQKILKLSATGPGFYLGTKMVFILIFIVVFCSCKGKRPFLDDPDGKREVEETIVASNPVLKLLTTKETGINFQNIITETAEDNFYNNNIKYNGGGISVLDVNNDGLQDLYFVCTNGKNKLYLNKGNFKFKDITDQAGVGSEDGFETSSAAVDINHDGWMDIYVCRAGVVAGDIRRNRLFINNRNLNFTEKAKAYGLDDPAGSTGANFFDYDNDGDLDLYLLNHPVTADYSNKFETAVGPDGTWVPVTAPKDAIDSDHFYRNDGQVFTDISKAAGIWNSAYGLSVSVSDLNWDGRPDVYVANDFIRPDFFYVNNADGTFTESLRKFFRHTSRHTMGSDLTDFDNDGLVDVFTVDMLPMSNYRLKATMVTMTQSLYNTTIESGYYEAVVRNVLQRNNGNGTFSDIGCLAGIHKTEWSWSGLVFDIDNDGLRDVHVSNGYRRNINDNDFFEFTFDSISKITDEFNLQNYFTDINQFLRLIPTYKSRNCCFRNNGDWTFSSKQGEWLDLPASWSNGAAWADLDNDGDLDLVVNNLEDPPFIYQNLTSDQTKNNYLQIQLNGSTQNPFAIGASAVIFYGGHVQYLELNPVRGIYSSVEYLLHFGLGSTEEVDTLIVRWPDGKTQTLTHLQVNQRLKLDYKDASGYVKHLMIPTPKELYFKENTTGSGLTFRHQENAFSDFDKWPLYLFKETELGPQLAAGDVNHDGLDDFFVGNSFDRPAALYIQKPGGVFKPSSVQTWEQEKIYEDHGAVFFDADQDGDLDLYVASGGMEAVMDLAWQHRLYINDGAGNFSKAQNALPDFKTVGSRLLAEDLDGDGDKDLLVGGRVAGNNWPVTPRSIILINNGRGSFTDATAQLAPDFEHCGMVTDLRLANLDESPQPELIVCGEWMPITVFSFNGTQWVNSSEKFGFAHSNGIWSSLASADLDGDGDIDLVSGNLGLNSRLSASEEGPLRVFAGDFDGNKGIEPIITYWEDGKNFPLVQKRLMAREVPVIKKKYLLSDNYSRAGIEEIFTKSMLDKSLNLFAYTLASCWWENQQGHFIRHDLPVPGQAAPVNAIICADFTGDGLIDLLMAGNKYGLEVETNRIDAGNGILLQGDGHGKFTFIENHESGFWASQEVRDLALLRGSGDDRYIVVANNNGPLQLFELKKNSAHFIQ